MSVAVRPKFCPECGIRLGEEDRFCGGCGGAIGGGNATGTVSVDGSIEATRVDREAKRRSMRYTPLVVALVGLGAVSTATLAFTRRSDAGGRSVESSPPVSSAHAPRHYRYTINIDLSNLRVPTQVRVEIEDPDGRRVVEERRRRPGEGASVTATATGDAVTWRIFYDNRLVKTVAATSSDGRPS